MSFTVYFPVSFWKASDMLKYIIHPVTPQRRILEKAVHMLRNEDGVCIYPTDTVYGMGVCAVNPKAIDRICKILEKDKSRLFSFICSDFAQISKYVRMDNTHFKLMKRFLPGPYTFILPATGFVPKKVTPKRKTIGVRIPDNAVCIELVKLLGEPLANTSISMPGQLRGDPENIASAARHEADIMLDVGLLDNPTGSTIIDLTGNEPVVVRSGKGPWPE
ncbi:MAG TPA: threonylcarbamoyl-AMP synthase [Fibrobacteres bacterium]|jgi:tRNA threonylcarbamoyl adenosine modification protein (Sua5/YciO/YrdC/YwlC family)|nr:threonylcarbamoyl-AMP synthase [Fibrobacterota bacterium]